MEEFWTSLSLKIFCNCMTERGPGPFVRRSSRTLWLEACLSLLLPGAFLPCSSAGQSCGIGCHCLSRKQQGGALISSGSTAQPPSCVERVSMRPPPEAAALAVTAPAPSLGQENLWVQGRGAPSAVLEILPYRPLQTLCFPISALMLEKSGRCRIVLVRLLG